VHHIDRDPMNNAIENLQLLTVSEHHALHNANPTLRTISCARCGASYSSPAARVYCSAACKAAARRARGVDRETRSCAMCGDEFSVEKSKLTLTCSRSCGAKLWRAAQAGTLDSRGGAVSLKRSTRGSYEPA
jgi:endogenous inhibitor of DNA gyrase (YacG/DUF329 family)